MLHFLIDIQICTVKYCFLLFVWRYNPNRTLALSILPLKLSVLTSFLSPAAHSSYHLFPGQHFVFYLTHISHKDLLGVLLFFILTTWTVHYSLLSFIYLSTIGSLKYHCYNRIFHSFLCMNPKDQSQQLSLEYLDAFPCFSHQYTLLYHRMTYAIVANFDYLWIFLDLEMEMNLK